MTVARRGRARRYRRSRALALYWAGSDLVCFDARHQLRIPVSPLVVECLSHLGDWRTPGELRGRMPHLGDHDAAGTLLDALATAKLVERHGDPAWPWECWAPEAAFFHFGTRDAEYPADKREHERALTRKAAHSPPPSATKSIAGCRVALPAGALDTSLGRALLTRRTWRNFSTRPIPLAKLATLLRMTWGIHGWGSVPGQGRVALKTSPSGGARHAIEAYVLARDVRGLKPGAYHYDPARHHLVDLQAPVGSATFVDLLAQQHHFGPAAAIVVMTATFARAMWRYPYSRAYRSILTEAGHLGQTFCVVATSLQLAPFCTMAFSEQKIESMLKLDAATESAMYVVGVGSRSPAHATHPGRTTYGSAS